LAISKHHGRRNRLLFSLPQTAAFFELAAIKSGLLPLWPRGSYVSEGMRRLLPILFFISVALNFVAAYGQGQFLFNTHDSSVGNDVRFYNDNQPITGNDWFLEVMVGPDEAHLKPLSGPLLALNRTGAGAGYTNPFGQIYTVPGTLGGTTVLVGYRVFEGATWDTATGPSGGPFVSYLGPGAGGLTFVALSAAPEPPHEVLLGTGVITLTAPEPAIWSLALFGVATIALFRCKVER
jgi:hypothetical protein